MSRWRFSFRKRFPTPISGGTSYHEPRFSQDYHDDKGRLIHAEWDGHFWQLFDANTSEFIGLWDKRHLPAQPSEIVFPPPEAKS